jgi:hypothetical protein
MASHPSVSLAGLSLQISTQPPESAVYQRIIKPFPTVLVTQTSGEPNDLSTLNLEVEAKLCRSDNSEVIDSLLNGKKTAPVQNGIAVFRTLKISATSSQLGTLSKIRFSLKSYQNGVLSDVLECQSVDSRSIEVFSHTSYIMSRQGAKKDQNTEVNQLADKVKETVVLSTSTSAPPADSSAADDLQHIILIPILEVYHDSSVQILLGMSPQSFEALQTQGGVVSIGQLADLKHRNPFAFDAIKRIGYLTDISHLVEVANRLLARAHDLRSRRIRD